MRRFLAYIVMMLTVISTLVFNTQSVFESTTDAMEYGRSTQLTFSLTERDKTYYDISNYPNLNPSIEKLSEIDIESKIMDRLDSLGVRNAEVELVKGIQSGTDEGKGYKVNVTFSPLSSTELSNVTQVLSYDGSLAFATVGDDKVYYQDRNELFDDPVAKIVYNGTTPYPAINIASTTLMDQLVTDCKNAATSHKDDQKTDSKSANRKYANDDSSDSEDSSDSQETKIYLWQNKTSEDTYNKAYGYSGETVDEEVSKKVIAVLDTSNYSSENKMITMTSDKDGNAFTVSSARAMVSMLNAEDYGFDIHYLYSNYVYAGLGSSAFKKTYIGFGVALALISLLLILFYGYSGITASINMLASVFLSLILFNLLGFEFSIAGIAGLCLVAVFSVFLSVNYFHHVKDELKKGRDVEKANREGYRKSFFGGLDTGLVLFFTSLFSFLICLGSYKTFFGAVMVGSLFTWIITTFLNKWATYWLCKDVTENNKPYFAFFKSKKESSGREVVKAGKKGRLPLYISLGISVLALGISLPLNYATRQGQYGFFNNSGSYAPSYQLSIEFATYNNSYTKLENSDTYLSYLSKIGEEDGSFELISDKDGKKDAQKGQIVYKASTVYVNVVEKTDDDGVKYYVNYFNVHTYQDLNSVLSKNDENKYVINSIQDGMKDSGRNIDINNEIINPTNDGNFKSDSFAIYSQETVPANLAHDVNNFFLVVFLIACFASIYAFVRFGLNMFLTILTSGSVYAALSVGFLSLSSLSFNPYVSFILLALNVIFDFMIVPMFNENKVIIKEKGLKGKASEEERAEILNGLVHRNAPITFMTLLSSLILSVPFVVIDGSLLSITILGVVLSLLAFVLLYSFALPFYLLCTSHISFRRFTDWMTMKKVRNNEKKNEKKDEELKEASQSENPNAFAPDGTRYVDPEGPHETIIIGMNEFRH